MIQTNTTPHGNTASAPDCDSNSCGCDVPNPDTGRREFLKLGSLLAGGLAFSGLPAMAGPFTEEDFEKLVPADKKLAADWVKSLFARGLPEVWRGRELNYIGMPVGGIGCGQLYLAGDGRLWLWDIFKSNYQREPVGDRKFNLMTMNGHYTAPVDSKTGTYSVRNGAEVAQGFAIRVRQGNEVQFRTLDSDGFPGVTFRGEYPIGRVSYVDGECPVRVEMEAFSPFIPLNAKDSALPATVVSFTITNPGESSVEVDLMGWLQNATCPYEKAPELGKRRNTLIRQDGLATLNQTVEPTAGKGLETRHGFGSMALSLIDAPADKVIGATDVALPLDTGSFDGPFKSGATADRGLDGKPLVGALGQSLTLAPGASTRIQFLLTWYFPLHQQKEDQPKQMAKIQDFAKLRRHYAGRFTSAADAALKIANDFERLAEGTRLWNQTWYDSTLPHWLLDRAFIPINCLATQTFHWFDNGRPWAWEGVDCCEGTCTHVWNYAQSMGRIFPEIERTFREKVDYGISFNSDGSIGYRGENVKNAATDGQAGTILRTLREHQMSADNAFLIRVWPNTKKAIEFLLKEDPKQQGMLEGSQANTLDAKWFGPMGWISSLYCAALRAGARMAEEMGDAPFAKTCAEVADRGMKNLVDRVYNGEYFIHLPPDYKRINSNRGSHIDQVLGQSWAWQVGLPRVLPKKETDSALGALWKYNFTPDAGGYAKKHTTIKGARVYAAVGEAGMIMTTWPHGGADLAVPGMADRKEDFETWIGPGGYFDECMTGFEYQVASHMIYEGEPGSSEVMHGLAVARAVHDRYAPTKRNPYNEIECGDHYSRAMAAYGVYLAASGFEYDGPKGHIAFAPRLTPENFRSAFTAAEGWGSFAQKVANHSHLAEIDLHYGTLKLRQLRLGQVNGTKAGGVSATVDDKPLEAKLSLEDGNYVVSFETPVRVNEGQRLLVSLT